MVSFPEHHTHSIQVGYSNTTNTEMEKEEKGLREKAR